jgi:hypothetical protein
MVKGKMIFKAIVGSQSYGTSTPTSDVDYKGVYVQPNDDILSFRYKEQYEVGNDESYYEVKRFIQLLSSANPTVLELLYSPPECILHKDQLFDLIVSQRDKFLTKKCLNSFGGYAVAQIKKAKGLDKKMNYEKHRVERKDVLDFCYVLEDKSMPLKKWLKDEGKMQEHCGLAKLDHMRDCYTLYYDHLAEMKSTNPRFEGGGYGYKGIAGEDSNEVRLSSIPKHAIKEAFFYFNKDGYSMHCKDYNEYVTWLQNRNVNRFTETKEHGQKIDGKNLLHCRRLLDMAAEIATGGTITVRRPNAEYLLQIRRGEVNLDALIEGAEEDLKKLDDLYEKSGLPEDVSEDFMNDLLLKIRKTDIYG